jgi:hypothetical protein
MLDNGTHEVQTDPLGAYSLELDKVLTDLGVHGITLHVSGGVIMVAGLDQANPAHVALLVANRTLLQAHMAYLEATKLDPGDQAILDKGLDTPIKARPCPPETPSHLPPAASASPGEVAAQRATSRATRRAACRAAVAASQAPPPLDFSEVPTSGAGAPIYATTLPADQVQAQARADRELRRANGGARPVHVVTLHPDGRDKGYRVL